MPSHELEDETIESFLGFLTASGVDCRLLEVPDRTPVNARLIAGLTTDALVEIDAQRVACDVMVVADDPSIVRDSKMIDEKIRPIAVGRGLVVELTGTFPNGLEAKKFVKWISQATKGSLFGEERINGLDVKWHPGPAPDVKAILLSTDESPLLSEQIYSRVVDPLTHKLTKQAVPAQEEGVPYGLLLTLVGDTSIRQGTYWLAQHPSTFAEAVTRVFAELSSEPAFTALRMADREWRILQGQVWG